MDAIINDPDSMKIFRNHLCDTVDDLERQLRSTEEAIEEVSKSWKDIQFAKFKSKFEEDVKTIKPMCNKINEFESDVLYPLEEKLRRYLKL